MPVKVRTLKLKNLPVIGAFFLGVQLLVYLLNGGKDLYDAFLETSVNARVIVRGYNHDNPLITMLNGVKKGKKTGIILFPAASHYLRTNDSIVKKAGANTVTIVRDSADARIITHWKRVVKK
jgi:hypothetical protein